MPRPISPGETHTYGEWQSLGYQVQYGERSTLRDDRQRALFTADQVRPRSNHPLRPPAPGEYQQPAQRRFRTPQPARNEVRVTYGPNDSFNIRWEDVVIPEVTTPPPLEGFITSVPLEHETLQERANRIAAEEFLRQQQAQPRTFRRPFLAPPALSDAERAEREAQRLRDREERWALQDAQRQDRIRQYRAELEFLLQEEARYPSVPRRLTREYAPRDEPTGFQRFIRKVENRPERNEDEFGDQDSGGDPGDDPWAPDRHTRNVLRR